MATPQRRWPQNQKEYRDNTEEAAREIRAHIETLRKELRPTQHKARDRLSQIEALTADIQRYMEAAKHGRP